jgi:hypothetical protein
MTEEKIMNTIQRRHPIEVIVQRGTALYEKTILPTLQQKDFGKFVAIDIETGEYEIARTEKRAGDQLRKRLPDSQIFVARVGYAAARGFGGRKVRQDRP